MERSYELKQNWDSTLYYSLKIIQINPLNEQSYITIANSFDRIGKPDSALYYCRKFLQLNPKNQEVFEPLGYAFEKLKKIDSALYYFDKLIELMPEIWKFQGYIDIAYLYASSGNISLAFNNLDTSLSYLPKRVSMMLADVEGDAMKRRYTQQILSILYDQLTKDPEISNLRKEPEFKALMKKYFPDQYKE